MDRGCLEIRNRRLSIVAHIAQCADIPDNTHIRWLRTSNASRRYLFPEWVEWLRILDGNDPISLVGQPERKGAFQNIEGFNFPRMNMGWWAALRGNQHLYHGISASGIFPSSLDSTNAAGNRKSASLSRMDRSRLDQP